MRDGSGNVQFPLLSSFPDEAIIGLPHVLLLLWKLPRVGVKEGRFPQPIRLIPRTTAGRARRSGHIK